MRKPMIRLLSVGTAALVAGTAFLTANAGSQAHPAAAGLPTLTLGHWEGVSGSFPNIDPAQAGADYQINVEMLLHAGLVVIGTDNKVHLQLAKSVSVSKNHRVYTFTLRPNLRFSNGDKLTAADVVYSFKRAVAPSTANPTFPTYDGLIQGATEYNAGKSKSLPGVKAVGSSKVVITATQAAPYFLKQLTYQDHFVLDSKVEGSHNAGPNNNYMTSNCKANVGAGPFRVVCVGSKFFPGGRSAYIKLQPNPYYYGKKAHVNIVIPQIADATTGYNEYLSGQVESSGIPTANLAAAKKRKSEYHEAPSSDVTYVAMNTKDAPFDNVNCRKAFAWGINRDLIVKVLHGSPAPLYTVLPYSASYPGSIKNTAHPGGIPYYNPTKARQYAAKCKYTGVIKYTYNHSSVDSDNLAQTIANSVAGASGLTVKTNPITTQDWEQDISHPMTNSGLVATRYGWIQDYPDPQDYMDNLFTCKAPENIMGWCNKTFDSLVAKADASTKNSTRAKLYQQAEQILLAKDTAVAPYDTAPTRVLWKPKIHGLTLSFAYDEVVAKNLDWSQVTVK